MGPGSALRFGRDDDNYPRRNTTVKLFAGIGATSASTKPFAAASGSTSLSRQRMPQRSSRALRLASKASLDGAVCAPWRRKGP